MHTTGTNWKLAKLRQQEMIQEAARDRLAREAQGGGGASVVERWVIALSIVALAVGVALVIGLPWLG